ncbi:sulfurtransferase [Achromobacter aloeverae]|uniref:Sulfurtransferase n=2 Tax=Achromobacter aloeverae TaxID=1750518 RepID=A0A4Q1HMQ8_9BURK|nr:sulfurtransferase [Achromobacter aloeverae]
MNMTTRYIDAAHARQWLQDGAEIALVDVREAGRYGEGHALLAVNIPYSRLELDIGTLIPRLATRIVLIAENDRLAERAALSLAQLGYSQVTALRGGVDAWDEPLFQGVNVPSKAFAEYVEHGFHTPDISAEELHRLQGQDANLILLDSRTVEEHRRFHVPGAIACPGSELVPRFADLVPDPETLVVISCAGRTRGVMGAQTLLSAGVPNRVVALRGGTQGWRLAGLALETGPARESAPASPASRLRAQPAARDLASRHGIPAIDARTLAAWQDDPSRTTYVFDVRTREEYAAGHHPGASFVQGVQLIQRLDEAAAVRGARLVLADDDGIRATLTAYWLKQLGWEVAVLARDAGTLVAEGERGHPAPARPALPAVEAVDPAAAAAAIQRGALLLDTSDSAGFLRAHPQGARWINRSRLDDDEARRAGHVIVTGDDAGVAHLVALDLREHARVSLLRGGLEAWRAAGLPVASAQALPPGVERIDFLAWLHDRHEGNAASSAAYLEWEAALPARIGAPTVAGIRLAVPDAGAA